MDETETTIMEERVLSPKQLARRGKTTIMEKIIDDDETSSSSIDNDDDKKYKRPSNLSTIKKIKKEN